MRRALFPALLVSSLTLLHSPAAAANDCAPSNRLQLVFAELLRRPPPRIADFDMEVPHLTLNDRGNLLSPLQLDALNQGRAGNRRTAAAMEARIEQALRDQPIRSVLRTPAITGAGTGHPRIVTLADGTRALFKPHNTTTNRPGVGRAVLRIDRALGLYRVPVSVEREIPGLGSGTLQIFIEGARHDRPRGWFLGRIDPELELFDYLIGNGDRIRTGKYRGGNPNNQLHHRAAERSIAIDSEYSLQDWDPIQFGMPPEHLIKLQTDARDFAPRLRNVPAETLHTIMREEGLSERAYERLRHRYDCITND